MEDEIHILLVEDNPSYGRVVRRALQDDPVISRITLTSTAEMALRKMSENTPLAPDLILLDLSLPGISGLEAIPYMLEIDHDVKIIVLTQSDREDDVVESVSAGASGYILKESTPNQIREAIHSVAAGGACLHPKISKHLLDAVRAQPSDTQIAKDLSAKELATLKLIAKGLARKEVAAELGVSVTTVVTHLNRIYMKLNVNNAPAAVSKAYRCGILN